MIKAVIFDLGGVMISLSDEATKKYARKYIGINKKSMDVEYTKHVYALDAGKLTTMQFWQKICKDYNKKLPDNYQDFFTIPFIKVTKVNPDLIKYIKKLKKSGLRIACLSNIERSLAGIIKKMGILDILDTSFLSYRIKMSKPDPNIYRYVLKQLGLKPSEIIFIDNEKINIMPAKKMGINTVLAKHTEQVIKDLAFLTGVK